MTSFIAPAIAGIVLAAGKGTRMRSDTPKVLHTLAGRPMLDWVITALRQSGVDQTCVILSEDLQGFEQFIANHDDLAIALQKNRQGTGDAVAAAAWSFAGVQPAQFAAGRALKGRAIECSHVLISAGDMPALSPPVVKRFVDESLAAQAAVSVLGMRIPNPKGYGRLLVEGGQLSAIVEDKDATAAQRLIDACNTGIILAEKDLLFSLVQDLKANNAQREYYLTDCVRLARSRGLRTQAIVVDDWQSFSGINDKSQLAAVEHYLIQRLLAMHMNAGVSIRLPETVYVEAAVVIGADSEVGPGAVLKGHTKIGARCHIGAHATLDNCQIGDNVAIGHGCVLERCVIAAGERLPPLTVRLG